VILSVVRSHYPGKKATRERIYAAGESIAAWLGLGSWLEVATMQNKKTVDRMKKLILEKSTEEGLTERPRLLR
jgi:hypothetical protein